MFLGENVTSSATPYSTPTPMPISPPPQRGRSPPPRTPDSNGLTPSSQRSLARRRIESPPSPTPQRNIPQRRSLRTIRPRRFYGDTPTPSPPKLCSRTRHLKPHNEFIDPVTGEEYEVCNECRHQLEERRQHDLERMQAHTDEIEQQIQQSEQELQRLGLIDQGNLSVTILLIWKRFLRSTSDLRRRPSTYSDIP